MFELIKADETFNIGVDLLLLAKNTVKTAIFIYLRTFLNQTKKKDERGVSIT